MIKLLINIIVMINIHTYLTIVYLFDHRNVRFIHWSLHAIHISTFREALDRLVCVMRIIDN